tara:strand:- start:4462 stop:5064 length:603 start_codon:yes stop_codon:yes gene_type:complete
MIHELKGIIEKKTHTYVVIFVNGIGYKLNMSINSLEALPNKGSEVHILTYLHVREDILELYGFNDSMERNTFNLLKSISGIGPKLALTILSGISPLQLKDNVISGDLDALKSVPGVGAKTAKRIIIELKEKFIKSEDSTLGFDESSNKHSKLFEDVFNALVSLGYKKNYAKKACIDLEKKGDLQGDLESVIKKALKLLLH